MPNLISSARYASSLKAEECFAEVDKLSVTAPETTISNTSSATNWFYCVITGRLVEMDPEVLFLNGNVLVSPVFKQIETEREDDSDEFDVNSFLDVILKDVSIFEFRGKSGDSSADAHFEAISDDKTNVDGLSESSEQVLPASEGDGDIPSEDNQPFSEALFSKSTTGLSLSDPEEGRQLLKGAAAIDQEETKMGHAGLGSHGAGRTPSSLFKDGISDATEEEEGNEEFKIGAFLDDVFKDVSNSEVSGKAGDEAVDAYFSLFFYDNSNNDSLAPISKPAVSTSEDDHGLISAEAQLSSETLASTSATSFSPPDSGKGHTKLRGTAAINGEKAELLNAANLALAEDRAISISNFIDATIAEKISEESKEVVGLAQRIGEVVEDVAGYIGGVVGVSGRTIKRAALPRASSILANSYIYIYIFQFWSFRNSF